MILTLRAVRKSFGPTVTALAGVDAECAEGTFTAVMGRSGSGKSTLLHCAAGLERPDDGEITLGGIRVDRLSERARTVLRRDRVGFVFQAFNLVAALTAAQNVGLPLRLAGARPARDAVLAALDQVGLADRATHYPSELSGGEQQRVALARALITRPAVLFADEPTGALDSDTSQQVLALLRGLVDQHGLTVMMVSHDPVAAARADRVLLLADGRVVDELVGVDALGIAGRLATRGMASC